MIPRGVLDINEWMLMHVAWQSYITRHDAEADAISIESRWDAERSVLVCQSVRSGLDLVLRAFNWPAGSEILISAVTIPDMPRIIAEHGLVPVAVDVCRQTLAPDLDQLRARLTPRTRAILVAHLFGSRLDLTEISRFAREHSLELWEDVAQGFALDQYPGDLSADISFFSFGLIKSQTALGGGIMRIQDQQIAATCRRLQAEWPRQTSNVFRQKIYRAMLLRLLGRREVMSLVSQVAKWIGTDIDEWLSRSVRGFDPTLFFQQLRQRPCGELIHLLLDRLEHPGRRWVDQKAETAMVYSQLLPKGVLVGDQADFPVRWVYPISSRDSLILIKALRAQGFDATTRASALRVTPAPERYREWTTPSADDWVSRMVFLPLHPTLKRSHCVQIARTVAERESEAHR